MKVKKMLAVVLSMVAVASCTFMSASAVSEDSMTFNSGKMYAKISSTSANAYSSYAPGSYRIKRYVSATVYYRDARGAMQDKSDSQTVMEGGSQAYISFTGNNFVSMTSRHIVGDISKNFSVDV